MARRVPLFATCAWLGLVCSCAIVLLSACKPSGDEGDKKGSFTASGEEPDLELSRSIWSDSDERLIPEKFGPEYGQIVLRELDEDKLQRLLSIIESQPGMRGQIEVRGHRSDTPVIYAVTITEVGEHGYSSLTRGLEGIAQDGSNRTIMLSYGQRVGLSASVLGGDAPVYVQKMFGQENQYVFKDSDFDPQQGLTLCGVGGPMRQRQEEAFSIVSGLRTMRLAVSITDEYAAFVHDVLTQNRLQGSGDVAGYVQEAIESVVRLVNHIFQRECGVRFLLVADQRKLILPSGRSITRNANDPKALMKQNQEFIDSHLASSEYDIAHLFRRRTANEGFDGYAEIGSAFMDGKKAHGFSGTLWPIGNSFVGLVCHELGHQLGASHTHNHGHQGVTEYEPGSGSTIMAYPGSFTGPSNVQNFRDPYFHFNSLDEIKKHLGMQSPGFAVIVAEHDPPRIVSFGGAQVANRQIILEAEAESIYPISYCWERADGATVRSLYPTQSSVRRIPSPVFRRWESLPDTDDSVRFRLTVRTVSILDTGHIFGAWAQEETVVPTPR